MSSDPVEPPCTGAEARGTSVKVTGHRGAMALALQNTAASLQAAEDAGADEIEIDVRLTADDVPIIVHDAHLAKMTGDPTETRTLRDLPWATVSAIALADGQSVLTLPDVLARTSLPLQVEIKTLESVRVVTTVLADHPQDRDRCLVTSFSQEVLWAAQQLLPDLQRGWISSEYDAGAPALLDRLQLSWLFCGWPGLERTAVDTLHARGVRVGGWPLRSREDAQLALDLGLDAVTADDPAQARLWLAEAAG